MRNIIKRSFSLSSPPILLVVYHTLPTTILDISSNWFRILFQHLGFTEPQNTIILTSLVWKKKPSMFVSMATERENDRIQIKNNQKKLFIDDSRGHQHASSWNWHRWTNSRRRNKGKLRIDHNFQHAFMRKTPIYHF